MTTIPLGEAKNNLSRLVDEAAAGHSIIIAKHGRALARLVPFSRQTGQRIGAMKGILKVPEAFDAPLPDELLDAFEGGQTVRVLLDTRILLWALADDPKLTPKARKLIENASEVYISAASFWEMSIKVGLGKLDIDLDKIREYCQQSGFIELPIAVEHAIGVKDLDHHHRDPFDRLIVATAICEPMRPVTADPLVAKYTSLATLV